MGTTRTAEAAEDQTVQLGIWQPPSPGDFGPLTSLESTLGRNVDIIPWYQAWDSDTNSAFRGDKIEWVLDRGSIPMITWEPWNTQNGVNQADYSLRQITSGTHDLYIRSWAQGAKTIDGPIYLRFAHEMNGNWYPWSAGVNGNSADDYINAWIHVHGIFEAEGATNVQWIWSPNRDYPGSVSLPSLYPGDTYVDWVAIDGYNFGTEKSGMSWRSFNDTFKGTYDIVTQLSSRPVMIGETGSTEAGGDKAAWIRDGLDPENLATNFPRLKAVIWFNQVGSGNWPLSTSESAMNAFAEVTQSWLEITPNSDEGEPILESPREPSQTGRARVMDPRSPSHLLGAWWGTK
ncbi:hypothetical protein BH23CHL2_BH23CHL2_23980 [soil metagenome]